MQKILILDFGSQYTQLIARRVREMHVYCEIVPYNKMPELTPEVQGVILSGSPFSVKQPDALRIDLDAIAGKRPMLGICYGAQLTADFYGGEVGKSSKREYGKAILLQNDTADPFFHGIEPDSQVWMSHSDSILRLPEQLEVLAHTDSIPVAAFRGRAGAFAAPVYGIQFHPEVYHTLEGFNLLKNFVLHICGCKGDWTPAHFVEQTVAELREKIGTDKVIMALSGGVDSTVAASLLHRAIGDRLFCFFVDNGLLRKNEYTDVLASYQGWVMRVRSNAATARPKLA